MSRSQVSIFISLIRSRARQMEALRFGNGCSLGVAKNTSAQMDSGVLPPMDGFTYSDGQSVRHSPHACVRRSDFSVR